MAVPFSEHEAVVLLDYYLKSLSGELTRQEAIKECSEMLREIAINKGKEIDEVYRNITGIGFQMRRMEAAYLPDKIQSAASTRLFRLIVDIYRNNPEQYKKILAEAKALGQLKQLDENNERAIPQEPPVYVDTAIKYLKNNGIQYVDERNSDGILWVFGGLELFSKLIPLREYGIFFAFHPSGSDTPTGTAAWWTKDRIKRTDM